MNRYFTYITYDGTRYCGWQRQPNGLSVQQELEEALATALQQPVPVVGAGRTDAGVHAVGMAAHFDLPEPAGDLPELAEKLNRLLPCDIAVRNIAAVRDDAHARFDALARTYKYYVSSVKNPFNRAWVCRMQLRNMDFGRMNEACLALYEYTDFTSFSKLHTDVKTNNCRIQHAEWTQEGDVWVFTITADRFLRNMVRAIVGTLLEIGRGKRTVDEFRQLIEAKDRCRAGTSASACGLSLVAIDYPDELFIH
ncbi:MAG: tRNA pseudouridine(38-40) synthase TruA [Tannerella sp.]|jgi:tRNA pseudouridine38-40 synthase|nr:tRNA pseudouridine(38-40) synthase TruA [Tannerella sp.]